MKTLLSLSLSLVLLGCATTPDESMLNRIVGSWKGEEIDALVKQWGIPDRQLQVADTIIYEWTARRSFVFQGSASTTANTVGTTTYAMTDYRSPTTIEIECVRQFVTDQKGLIIDGSFHGDGCADMSRSGYASKLIRH